MYTIFAAIINRMLLYASKSLQKRVFLFVAVSASFFFIILSPVLHSDEIADIAVVMTRNIKPYKQSIDGLREVVNARLSMFDMEANPEKGQNIINSIRLNDYDLILGLGSTAAYTMSSNIKDIPVVFSMVADSERYNIYGENVTGVTLNIPLEKQFNVYKDVMPDIKRIGVLYSNNNTKIVIEKAQLLLNDIGLEFVLKRISSQKDIPNALNEILSTVDAVLLIYDPVVTATPRIVKEVIIFNALKKRIPVIGFNKWSVTVGAVCCLFSEYVDVGQQTGEIVKQILEGSKPSSIAVEYPQKIKMLFNEKAVKRIIPKVKLNIPDDAYIWKGNQ